MSDRLAFGDFFGRSGMERRWGDVLVQLRRATLPAEDVPLHSHDEAHYVFALDATYRSAAKGMAGDQAPGFLVYNPAGVVHRDCFGDLSHGGRFVSVSLPATFLSDAAPDHAVAIDRSHAHAAVQRLIGVCVERRSEPLRGEQAICDLVTVTVGGVEGTPIPDWIGRARDALLDHACDPTMSIRMIAAGLDVHPVYLARAYRRWRGVRPYDDVQRLRVLRAIGMIRDDADLALVAADTGFADQSHMTRAFRRWLGTTPARYRDALR